MSEYNRKEISEEEKIDLIRIINDMWKGFKRFWLLLLLLTVALAGVFFFRAYRSYRPVYTASATFTVESDTSSLYSSTSYLNERTASQIVNTFPYILSSSLLQDMVAEDLGVDTVPGSISVETLGSTNMITVLVTSSDAEDAYLVLESVIEHYPEVAESIIGEVKMNMLDTTDVPESASNPPSFRRSALKGALVGVAISFVILLIYAFTRNTIHEEDDFKKMLNVDCICAIPQIVFKKRGKEFRKDISIYNRQNSQTFLGAFRVVRARIEMDAKKYIL